MGSWLHSILGESSYVLSLSLAALLLIEYRRFLSPLVDTVLESRDLAKCYVDLARARGSTRVFGRLQANGQHKLRENKEFGGTGATVPEPF